LQTIGIIRGEKPAELSHTLKFCLEQNMQLEFRTRKEYANKAESSFLISLEKKFGEHILIPEGGFNQQGVKGAAMITDHFKSKNYTHICCAIGTATTFAGLITSSSNTQQVIGFPALKNMNDINDRIKHLSVNIENKHYELIGDYHFGGYAKYSNELISFMNNFFESHQVPLDFIYTAKMMFGVIDLIDKNYFLPQSKILCIHTGGLQGNLSLPNGVLNFCFL
jgi:1-aminocyclopropane-1-carboxylate deaminase/D-cysteine desulfhydrase-like pyridoxal-dependent ACC family enzyme